MIKDEIVPYFLVDDNYICYNVQVARQIRLPQKEIIFEKIRPRPRCKHLDLIYSTCVLHNKTIVP